MIEVSALTPHDENEQSSHHDYDGIGNLAFLLYNPSLQAHCHLTTKNPGTFQRL